MSIIPLQNTLRRPSKDWLTMSNRISTDLDLLYQILIDWGLPLDLPHEIEEIDGFHLHIVDKNALIACFDANIPESVMRKIAGKKPLRAVFRDGSFRSSPGKLNIEGIFKTIAPDTTLRVI